VSDRLQDIYRTIVDEGFPPGITVSFDFEEGSQKMHFEKVTWTVDIPGEGLVRRGLRYGENPGQQAALYRLVSGNLVFGGVETVKPGRWLASDLELVQTGRHPGKINITDVDNALSLLRYFDEPVAAILKHNNPCGAAIGKDISDAYFKANRADRLAAFGGTVALNREVDEKLAEVIVGNSPDVVVAPDYLDGALDALSARRSLRVMRIGEMARLREWSGEIVVDFKSLIDGGLILQTSYMPGARTLEDVKRLPLGYYRGRRTGKIISEVGRRPTEEEYRDMWFGWLVQSVLSSNSVIYVRDGVTVGIGVGEQDRVGAAKIARDKAYEKMADFLCFEETGGLPFNVLESGIRNEGISDKRMRALFESLDDPVALRDEVLERVREENGGLRGATISSDGLFPFMDGVVVGLREGATAVIQPGGSVNDREVIQACNHYGATMVFTEQRSFKH
jgi:phosphoribosylaminoimidazolecarboxamide formyltransferase/IMP cyclohydrolase